MPPSPPQPPAGKVARAVFDRVILPRLGQSRPEVLVGPRHGVDVGIVDLGGGRVLVATMDPLFVMPAYGWERAAWFALHIVASDAATSAIPPQWVTVDLNLPLEMPEADLAAFWEGFHQACREIGVAVITGHTGRYAGCAFPTIGAATVMGVGDHSRYVTPAMAQEGDAVIVTKGVAIETVGQLGVVMRDRIAARLGAAAAAEAEALFQQMSVVRDAAVAAAGGVRADGVTGMHDATEFGLWGALCEVAEAAGLGMAVAHEAIPVPPIVRRMADWLDFDPYAASSEGTLVLTCGARHRRGILRRLEDAGIVAAEIGEMRSADAGVMVTTEGRTAPLNYPRTDPFWPLLESALAGSSAPLLP